MSLPVVTPSPIRVLLVKSLFDEIDGSAELLVNYAVYLKAAGHEPRVLTFTPSGKANPYARRLQGQGVPVSCVRRHLTYYWLRLLRKLCSVLGPRFIDRRLNWGHLDTWVLRHILERNRPAVVHLIQNDAPIPGAIRVANECGYPVIWQEVINPRFAPQADAAYDRLASALPHCAIVCALSPDQARQVEEKIPYLGTAAVLPLIVTPPAHVNQAPLARPLTFGFAARLEHWKGPLLLLEAFARISADFPEAVLRIAGTGALEDRVHARARELGISERCVFSGAFGGAAAREEFLRSIDVLVQPSLADGTPNSIIEAMAHGIPVIASRVGGIPDLLTADSGRLVPPGDVDRLYRAMRELALAAALRARLGERALERWQSLFSPEVVGPLLLHLYRTAIATSHFSHPLDPSDSTVSHPWQREPAAVSGGCNPLKSSGGRWIPSGKGS